ncbi:MAG TPA: type 4a pilus biogenesis protein PilO [Pirellulaceae bacterium]|nr:type 4a pilus biogenesis protein PilO [Pirellulaceae bacterium]
MKKTPQRPKRTWLFAVLVAAGVAGYVILVFLPGERATAALREEAEQKLAYVADSGAIREKIAVAEAELAHTNEFISAWREAAPNEHRLAKVFVDLTEHAEGAGADIVRFEPQPIDRMDALERIPVSIACEGSFAQLFTFLSNLESLEPDFWITELKFEPVVQGVNRLRCELNLAFFADRREISD